MRLRHTLMIGAGSVAAAAALAAWAALSPIEVDARERERVFEIPKGTWARKNAGQKVEVLPPQVHLTLGVKDVLVMKNADEVPQMFGPVLIMPGQSFRMPFGVASTYQFACSAHVNGSLDVVVAPAPEAGWARLRWRLAGLVRAPEAG